MPQILIVEDRKRLVESLRQGLEEEGFNITAALTGEEGYYLATTQSPDVVVLDLMLPKRDGFQVLQDLRNQSFSRPVLILTARDAVEDRVKGLDLGADDYLVKPFAFAELVARVRALLRRHERDRELILRADNLELDLLTRRVTRHGVEIELSKRELDLLEYLLRHQNHAVTREMLSRDVWNEPDGVLTNVIEVYVNTLRKKVEKAGERPLIHTLRGVGYVLRNGE